MPLVPSSVLLCLAEEGNFALPAFNVPVPEFILWILEEGERLRAPVIIQVAPVEYQTLDIRIVLRGSPVAFRALFHPFCFSP
jgi:fructose/tagatose bisphosphate aldolase